MNNHLLGFERAVTEGSVPDEDPLAKTMMVFMVRGLFSKLQFAYVQFPCTTLTGDLLFEPFWEAISRIERLGLKVFMSFFCSCTGNLLIVLQVLAATLDGNAVNRRLIKLHDLTSELVYKVPNCFAADERDLYFFFRPSSPH